MCTFLTQIDLMNMKQDIGLSYFYGASLFCGAALNIRTLQQRWMIFNSFQIIEDGKTPFILKMFYFEEIGPLLYIFPEKYDQVYA